MIRGMYQTGMLRALTPTRLLSGVSDILAPARSSNPHYGHLAPYRDHRDDNPTPVTWLLLAGAAAVVVGGGIAWSMRDKGSSPPVIGGGGSGGGGGGSSGGGSTSTGGGYVGKPGYTNWPHKNVFGNETDFLFTLNQLGYDVDWDQPICPQQNGKMAVCKSGCTSVICKDPSEAITAFQHDYNLFYDSMADTSGPGVAKKVSADGLLGPGSINALNFIKQLFIDSSPLGGWQDLILNIRSGAEIS